MSRTPEEPALDGNGPMAVLRYPQGRMLSNQELWIVLAATLAASDERVRELEAENLRLKDDRWEMGHPKEAYWHERHVETKRELTARIATLEAELAEEHALRVRAEEAREVNYSTARDRYFRIEQLERLIAVYAPTLRDSLIVPACPEKGGAG